MTRVRNITNKDEIEDNDNGDYTRQELALFEVAFGIIPAGLIYLAQTNHLICFLNLILF